MRLFSFTKKNVENHKIDLKLFLKNGIISLIDTIAVLTAIFFINFFAEKEAEIYGYTCFYT